MRVDQTAAVFRVGRRRLARHIAALRFHAAEAQRELAGRELDDEAHTRLALAVSRLEANIAELERALDAAPKVEPVDHAQVYMAWARD